MQLVKRTSTKNTGYLKGRGIHYIVLHYTAGTSSKQGTARAIADMFANPNSRAASADFIVDDVETVQYNGDIENRYTYAVGGELYKVKYNSLSGMYYGKCKNSNSISIEMCSSKTNRKSLNVSDRDWFLTDAVVKNAVELTLMLMRKYNVPVERVITHSMINGKPCPQPWSIDENALRGWYAFKAKLKGTETQIPDFQKGEDDMTQKETQALVDSALTGQKAEIIAELSKMMDGMKPKVYRTLDDIPETDWARPVVEKAVEKIPLYGDQNGNLNLTEDKIWILAILDRLGLLE